MKFLARNYEKISTRLPPYYSHWGPVKYQIRTARMKKKKDVIHSVDPALLCV